MEQVKWARPLFVCLQVLAFVTALPALAAAQVFTGRIDLTVVDSTGAVLPGVTVGLTGPQNATAVTDQKGEARFLNLTPGTYAVAAKLQGFADYVNREVAVLTGSGTPLRVTMGVAGVTAEVSVTGGSPLVSPRKMTTATNVTTEQLQEIPSARDPWVVLQTVPGVIVDRVNVGGAESGQQSNYQAKGSPGADNTWNIDGIAITDMGSVGSTPTYYDFDMFQEMQVTTGGTDLTMATGGVGLNFVLKSGSNTPRGSARMYFENESLQANNMPADLAATLGGKGGKGNRIKEYMDYGAEVGGPILRDRLWAWGAYGKTDVTTITLANTPDQTILDNRSLKLTGQATDDIRLGYTYFRGDKLKYGRDASATRPPETTWDQSGPTTVHKGEANFVVSNNLFFTGRGAHVGGGFALIPQGGLDTAWYTDDAGVHYGSFIQSVNDRPSWTVTGEGNYFLGRHEIKFGAGYRKAETGTEDNIPGYGGFAGIHTTHDGYPNMKADIWVPTRSRMAADYTHAFLGDTISWSRLTLNLGLRWDRQAAGTMASTQAGFPAFSALLPDVASPATEDALVFTSISPRIGLTYALGESRRTIARAGYASFADQMSGTAAFFLSTVGDRGLYVYDVTDLNGNKIVDPEEVGGIDDCGPTGPRCFSYGFRVSDPAGTGSTPQHTIGDYSSPRTQEFQLGLDHELLTNFAVSGTFTFRHFDNFNWRNNGLTGLDYAEIGTLEGTATTVGAFSTPIYGATRIPADPSRTVYRSRPDYYQRYLGFEFAATKRMSNRWMGRLGFSTNRHREYFESRAGITDPTPGATSQGQSGQLVVRNSTGSGKSNIFQVLPTYQVTASGLYQAPWGINLAASLVSREGFAKQYYRSAVNTTDPLQKEKLVSIIDENGQYRLPNVNSLDVRVGKEFGIGRTRLNVDLDVFNVLNSATVLGQEYDQRLTSFDTVREIMNPRVLRLGARFNF